VGRAALDVGAAPAALVPDHNFVLTALRHVRQRQTAQLPSIGDVFRSQLQNSDKDPVRSLLAIDRWGQEPRFRSRCPDAAGLKPRARGQKNAQSPWRQPPTDAQPRKRSFENEGEILDGRAPGQNKFALSDHYAIMAQDKMNE
jgi:hypothetical protein